MEKRRNDTFIPDCGLHLLPSVSLHCKISLTPVMRGPACHYVTQVSTSDDNIRYIGTHHVRTRRSQSISNTLVVTLLAPHIPSIAHLRFIASSFLASIAFWFLSGLHSVKSA
jgi:hypothetical protein